MRSRLRFLIAPWIWIHLWFKIVVPGVLLYPASLPLFFSYFGIWNRYQICCSPEFAVSIITTWLCTYHYSTRLVHCWKLYIALLMSYWLFVLFGFLVHLQVYSSITIDQYKLYVTYKVSLDMVVISTRTFVKSWQDLHYLPCDNNLNLCEIEFLESKYVLYETTQMYYLKY